MALSRLSLAFSLLLLSLLVISSAGDYDDAYSSKYAGSPQAKPEGVEFPHYYTKPVDQEKPDYDKKPEADKPMLEGEEKPNYGMKQDIYKPKPEEKQSEVPKGEDNSNYGTKPDYYKAKPEEKPKNDRKPYVVKPEEQENQDLTAAVEGLILCKSGSKNYPIKGAFATVKCKAVDEVGVEKTVSICSEATDEKGYFFATFSDHLRRNKLRLKECKVYLKSSPLQTCNIPTNVNKAIDGALLSGFRVLPKKKTKLYSVRPFFYTSEEAGASPQYGY